jgi:hypothetical protein
MADVAMADDEVLAAAVLPTEVENDNDITEDTPALLDIDMNDASDAEPAVTATVKGQDGRLEGGE